MGSKVRKSIKIAADVRLNVSHADAIRRPHVRPESNVMTAFRITVRALSCLVLAVFAAPFLWEIISDDYFMAVTEESMEPTYHVGDVLVVQKPSGDELDREGNVVVVAFTPGVKDTPYVRRVLETTSDGAILTGDNDDTPDPDPVTSEQVVGTPRLALTGGLGQAYLVTQSPWVRFPLAALAVLGLVLPLGKKAGPAREEDDWDNHEMDSMFRCTPLSTFTED